MLRLLLSTVCTCCLVMMLNGQAYPDRHSTSYTDAWLSCEETTPPNIKRDAGHWIMYEKPDRFNNLIKEIIN